MRKEEKLKNPKNGFRAFVVIWQRAISMLSTFLSYGPDKLEHLNWYECGCVHLFSL